MKRKSKTASQKATEVLTLPGVAPATEVPRVLDVDIFLSLHPQYKHLPRPPPLLPGQSFSITFARNYYLRKLHNESTYSSGKKTFYERHPEKQTRPEDLDKNDRAAKQVKLSDSKPLSPVSQTSVPATILASKLPVSSEESTTSSNTTSNLPPPIETFQDHLNLFDDDIDETPLPALPTTEAGHLATSLPVSHAYHTPVLSSASNNTILTASIQSSLAAPGSTEVLPLPGVALATEASRGLDVELRTLRTPLPLSPWQLPEPLPQQLPAQSQPQTLLKPSSGDTLITIRRWSDDKEMGWGVQAYKDLVDMATTFKTNFQISPEKEFWAALPGLKATAPIILEMFQVDPTTALKFDYREWDWKNDLACPATLTKRGRPSRIHSRQ